MERIGYLPHDLSNADVRRRVSMFMLGGSDVTVAGLTRTKAYMGDVTRKAPIVLGTSEDGKLLRRAVQVGAISLSRRMLRIPEQFRGVGAVVARNLEMLVLSRRLITSIRPRPRLVYECIDVHRLMTQTGAAGFFWKSLEKQLLRSVDLVLTSSMAFVDNHFARGQFDGRVIVVENKLLKEDQVRPAAPSPPGPPWRVGWFGVLRCRRSFELLASLAERGEGRLEVVIRGKPSPAIFPDFVKELKGRRNIFFGGPYDNIKDAERIYGGVHFVWSMDFSDPDGNSSWLLPNRLYECGYHSTPPIALATVETGRFLDKHNFGLRLKGASQADLDEILRVTRQDYLSLVDRMKDLPRSLWVAEGKECEDVVAEIFGRMTPLGIHCGNRAS